MIQNSTDQSASYLEEVLLGEELMKAVCQSFEGLGARVLLGKDTEKDQTPANCFQIYKAHDILP